MSDTASNTARSSGQGGLGDLRKQGAAGYRGSRQAREIVGRQEATKEGRKYRVVSRRTSRRNGARGVDSLDRRGSLVEKDSLLVEGDSGLRGFVVRRDRRGPLGDATGCSSKGQQQDGS